MRLWLVLAALNGFLAVAAGAYGHHALGGSDPAFRDAFVTGVTYQMWHALALLGVAWLADRGGAAGRTAAAAGVFFVAGIVAFSGSLYYLGFMGELLIANAAPMGGIFFLLGWVMLAWAALR